MCASWAVLPEMQLSAHTCLVTSCNCEFMLIFLLLNTSLQQLIAFEALLHEITPARFQHDDTCCTERMQ